MKSLLFRECIFLWKHGQWAEITQLNATGFTIASFNFIGLRLFLPLMLNEDKCSRPGPRPNPRGQHFYILAGRGQNFVFAALAKILASRQDVKDKFFALALGLEVPKIACENTCNTQMTLKIGGCAHLGEGSWLPL